VVKKADACFSFAISIELWLDVCRKSLVFAELEFFKSSANIQRLTTFRAVLAR